MSRRRHGSKPAFALWMLVAVADIALLAASAGLFVLLLLVAAVVTAAGAMLAVRLSHRYDVVDRLVRLQRRNSAAHSWLLRHATTQHWLMRPMAVRRPGRMTYARRRA